MASSSPSQVILVTGANRSLGFAILQAAGLRLPTATYIMGSRSVEAGNEAVAELKKLDIKAEIEVCQLDITQDESIFAAVDYVKSKYGKLDVLINNGTSVQMPRAADLSDFRATWDFTLSTGVTSFAMTTQAFLPLLRQSPAAKVINVSSARGSFGRSIAGKLPPTVAVPYCVSKTALNMVTVEQEKSEDVRFAEEEEVSAAGKVRFYACSPGHMKTAFNNFRGTKDPLVGSEVVLQLLLNNHDGGTFWEFEDGKMQQVPW